MHLTPFVTGTVKQLDLRGQHISDVTELKEMLRHLVPLRDLILDYNDVQVCLLLCCFGVVFWHHGQRKVQGMPQ